MGKKVVWSFTRPPSNVSNLVGLFDCKSRHQLQSLESIYQHKHITVLTKGTSVQYCATAAWLATLEASFFDAIDRSLSEPKVEDEGASVAIFAIKSSVFLEHIGGLHPRPQLSGNSPATREQAWSCESPVVVITRLIRWRHVPEPLLSTTSRSRIDASHVLWQPQSVIFDPELQVVGSQCNPQIDGNCSLTSLHASSSTTPIVFIIVEIRSRQVTDPSLSVAIWLKADSSH